MQTLRRHWRGLQMPHDAVTRSVEMSDLKGRLRLTFPATPLDVRKALHTVMARFGNEGFEPEELGSLELALAETLNNIVEHAYADRADGEIDLRIARGPRGVYCEVTDDGRDMPDGIPPAGITLSAARPVADLPEGGFGWFLIREVTHDLRYMRIGGKNRVSFRLAIGISDEIVG